MSPAFPPKPQIETLNVQLRNASVITSPGKRVPSTIADKQAEKDLQTVKNVIAQELPQIIKDLSAEIHLVAQQGQTLGQPALQTSAERMRQQLRLFVEALTLTGPKT